MRATLPVQPRLKTMSERATIEYVRHHTGIPVPRIHSFDAQSGNDLSFEYMIMERVRGSSLKGQWRHMSWLKKEQLVRNVVKYLAGLFRGQRLPRLGNLYMTQDLHQMPTTEAPCVRILGHEHSTPEANFCLGEIVSIPFFYDDNWSADVLRGPFEHSQDWFASWLRLCQHEANNLAQDEIGSDDDLQSTASIGQHTDASTESDESSTSKESIKPWSLRQTKIQIQRLINILSKVVPRFDHEEYILSHQDMSGGNILVDEQHNLSSIIDWECVHSVPLWLACKLPKFLCGHPASIFPSRTNLSKMNITSPGTMQTWRTTRRHTYANFFQGDGPCLS